MVPVLAGFILDWLAVSGWVTERSFINTDVLERGENAITFYLQPLLRFILAVLLFAVAFRYTENTSTIILATPLFLFSMALCAVLILAGVLGRISTKGIISTPENSFSAGIRVVNTQQSLSGW